MYVYSDVFVGEYFGYFVGLGIIVEKLEIFWCVWCLENSDNIKNRSLMFWDIFMGCWEIKWCCILLFVNVLIFCVEVFYGVGYFWLLGIFVFVWFLFCFWKRNMGCFFVCLNIEVIDVMVLWVEFVFGFFVMFFCIFFNFLLFWGLICWVVLYRYFILWIMREFKILKMFVRLIVYYIV